MIFLFKMGTSRPNVTGWVLPSTQLNGRWPCHVFYLQCLSGVLGTHWWALVWAWAPLTYLSICERRVHSECPSGRWVWLIVLERTGWSKLGEGSWVQMKRGFIQLLMITLCDLTLNCIFYFSYLWKPAS